MHCGGDHIEGRGVDLRMNLHLQIQFEKPNTNKNTITNINTNSLHTCVVYICIFSYYSQL